MRLYLYNSFLRSFFNIKEVYTNLSDIQNGHTNVVTVKGDTVKVMKMAKYWDLSLSVEVIEKKSVLFLQREDSRSWSTLECTFTVAYLQDLCKCLRAETWQIKAYPKFQKIKWNWPSFLNISLSIRQLNFTCTKKYGK